MACLPAAVLPCRPLAPMPSLMPTHASHRLIPQCLTPTPGAGSCALLLACAKAPCLSGRRLYAHLPVDPAFTREHAPYPAHGARTRTHAHVQAHTRPLQGSPLLPAHLTQRRPRNDVQLCHKRRAHVLHVSHAGVGADLQGHVHHTTYARTHARTHACAQTKLGASLSFHWFAVLHVFCTLPFV